ncbi:hypothetical protein, partial [Rhizobium pisi]
LRPLPTRPAKNPIAKKAKPAEKIDGFVSSLRPSPEGLFVCRFPAVVSSRARPLGEWVQAGRHSRKNDAETVSFDFLIYVHQNWR